MKDFDESVIGRLRAQEREIERLKVKEKVTEATIDHGLLTGLADDDHPQYVKDTGDETIAGVKTFSSIPVLPASNPTTDNQAVRKGFADATYGRPVFLTTPLTSTSWNGDSFSTTGKTLIDLSAVFGVPAGVKAVMLECAINDSGSLTYSTYGGAWIIFSGENIDAWSGQGINLEKEPNDAHRNAHMIVACNEDGDIYYRINASGTGTMDVVLKVWGYWL